MSGCGFAGKGLFGDSFTRPDREAAQFTRRPPDRGNAPLIAGSTGFGTASGATVTSRHGLADQARGTVAIRIGANPAAAGTLTLDFPAGVPAGGYFVAAEWAALFVTEGPPFLIDWIASRPLVPGEVVLLAYAQAVMT